MGRVFHFSAGHSSAKMVLDNYRKGDLVIFCDTGREHEDTYRFLKDFTERTGIPVVILRGDFRKEVIIKERMVPNRYKRKCTINLKIKKARRYLRSIGWFRYTQFIGFRFDEPDRYKDYVGWWKAVDTIFPLVDAGETEESVEAFWSPVSWKLGIPKILKNCDLCFQKGIAAVLAILQKEPWRAEPWIEDEETAGYTYFPNVSMRQLRERAGKLTKNYDLNEIKPALNCSCTA